MSERKSKDIRKKVKKVSKELILNFLKETEAMPFRTRFKVAMKILFHLKYRKDV